MSTPQNTESSNQPIKFTRKRTTTKTRTAASSARRRQNLPLCHASANDAPDSGKDAHSWFARKSTMMTDSQIRSHLVSGGAKSGGDEGVSFIGDLIVGGKEEKKKKKRRGGPRFAWEENEGEDDDNYHETHKMTSAPPTLMDIMDEKDEVDLMSPLKLNQAFNGGDTKPPSSTTSKKRSRNDTLAHLAIFSETGGLGAAPTDRDASIGSRLLRVWGYRSRLGVALVPMHGFDNSDKCLLDSLDRNATHEVKWLASKRLRAVHLPSIQNNHADEDRSKTVDVGVDTRKNSKILVIPPPKTNKHGIGYDPFRNAPEFKAFHEHRRRMAQKHGKADQGDSASRQRHRYFTDDLDTDARRPWEGKKSNTNKDDFDDDSDDNPQGPDNNRHSHYAADRNYEHFIGSKASSGFALEDEDDANVYDGGEADNFPQRGKPDVDGELSNYALEVQSPVASDEEDNALESSLFGDPSRRKSKPPRQELAEADGQNLADAWSSWGHGVGSGASGANFATRALTQDGKPPLTGFVLTQKFPEPKQNNTNDARRWEGPKLPPGYVLTRHVFPKEETTIASSNEMYDRADCGLGLDLQARSTHNKQLNRPPKVLPSSEPNKAPAQKLLAKDGTALNFHAVRESMKNRFVSGSNSTTQESSQQADLNAKPDREAEEWVDITIATWVPARLLCKRLGVAIPTDYGGTADASTSVRQAGAEEEYFKNAIYDPAVARRRLEDSKEDSDAKKQPAVDKPAVFDSVDDAQFEAEVSDGPTPTRPAESIFQLIFNVESDVEISGDEDEELPNETAAAANNDVLQNPSQANAPDITANNDILQHTSQVNEFDIHGRARKKRQMMARDGGKINESVSTESGAAPMPPPERESHAISDKSPPASTEQPKPPPSSDESSSTHTERRRKYKRKHRRRESDSDSDESSRRRRKHKHRSRSSYKEKRRKKDKRR